MFVSQAHSFSQQARLAITLAWVAGYTNVLTLLTCATVTTHLTGSASSLGRDLASGNLRAAAFWGFLIGVFFLGAMLAGLFTEWGRRAGWESIYVLPMSVEAALLALFAVAVEMHDRGTVETGPWLWVMSGLATMAMGLQNAAITHISSGVVRTTHVTGVVTDLGLESVRFLLWLRDRRRDFGPGESRALIHSLRAHPSARRLALLASIVGSFTLGAGLGAVADAQLQRWAMFPPVLFLLWVIFVDKVRPIAELEEADLRLKQGLDLPGAMAVYHLRAGAGERMPNLLAWADRVPPAAKVVVLELSSREGLGRNTALELVAVRSRFIAQGRHLVIAGLSPEQFGELEAAGMGQGESLADLSSDLELAIARGLVLLGDRLQPERAREAG